MSGLPSYRSSRCRLPKGNDSGGFQIRDGSHVTTCGNDNLQEVERACCTKCCTNDPALAFLLAEWPHLSLYGPRRTSTCQSSPQVRHIRKPDASAGSPPRRLRGGRRSADPHLSPVWRIHCFTQIANLRTYAESETALAQVFKPKGGLNPICVTLLRMIVGIEGGVSALSVRDHLLSNRDTDGPWNVTASSGRPREQSQYLHWERVAAPVRFVGRARPCLHVLDARSLSAVTYGSLH